MTVLIAVPMARISMRVTIETSRAWSVVDETILLAIGRQSMTLDSLVANLAIPRQVVVASVTRLMRFRLVEIALVGATSAFQLSDFGRRSTSAGAPLPTFPKFTPRNVAFVVDFATGEFFTATQVRRSTRPKLEAESAAGREVRYIEVCDGGPSLSPEANMARLSEIAVRSWDEQVSSVNTGAASVREDEFMIVAVADGMVQRLPDRVGPRLRALVEDAAARPAGTRSIVVSYNGPAETPIEALPTHACRIRPDDLIIGGAAHRDALGDLLARAHRRLILHSTFLDLERFRALLGPIRDACRRGVRIDILWGDNDDVDVDDGKPRKTALVVPKIADLVRDDPELRGNVRFQMNTTGSHAKIVLLDTEYDGWMAVVGSCNWLSTPFNAVELSVILRDAHAVADVCRIVQVMTGRRGVADDLAHELAITANDLRREPERGGPDRVTLVVGGAHDGLMRRAAESAKRRLTVGCHRLGSTARPGAILQGEAAAEREVDVTVLYTMPAGPLKKRHARVLVEEAAGNGVGLACVGKTHLHGKFILWDADDVVVTSLNWTSSAVDHDAPWNDVGVHISSLGIADSVHRRLATIYPGLLLATLPKSAEG